MTSRDEITSIESALEFRQDWPYVGQVLKRETRLAGSGSAGVLKRSTVSYGCHQSQVQAGGAAPSATTSCDTPVAWAPGKVYFPFATSSVEDSWDINGTAMPRITTTNTYAGYADGAAGAIRQFGDLTQVGVDISDGGVLKQRKVTGNEYQPAKTDGANWQLGRLKRATVTSTQY